MNSVSQNLVELGHFIMALAFAISLLQAFAPMLARKTGVVRLAQVSVQGAFIVGGLLTLGGAIMIHAFVSENFSVLYVAQNSNSQLPIFYQVAALWGGHEGSLYLWAWIMGLYTMYLAWQGRSRFPQRLPVLLAVQGFLMLGFLGLILFLSNPFDRLLPAPVDGRDLNPLLQDPGMVIHPPMLYLGYVGFSVPFAFAITALVTRWDSELWVGLIRRWALVAWVFLTIGIMLGGWWAYYELGWGGYWAWDPVENASFMPWLLGTALIHSITVQEHRRMLHTWNIFLVISTFALSLLGTFLVRSGVLSSVHAFAVDPGRGLYILIFMTVVLVISFGLFLYYGRQHQARESFVSGFSRESFYIFNNVFFTVACACVLLATLYPLATEALTPMKITVGAPYFNAVMVPIMLLIVLLMAFAPLVPWRKANPQKVITKMKFAFAAAFIAGAYMAWYTSFSQWTAIIATFLVTLLLVSMLTDYVQAVLRRRKSFASENVVVSAQRTLLRNRRFYGGMIVHFGIAVIAIGLTGSGLFRSESAVLMKPGDQVEIGGHVLRFDGTDRFKKDNYFALQGILTSVNEGYVLRPERRKYPVQEMPTTEAGIHSNLFRDVYAVIGEKVKDSWGIHVYVNPLVQFIWLGGFIIVVGVMFSLTQRIRLRQSTSVSDSAAASAKA